MPSRIQQIADLLSEDGDPLADFHKKWESKTVLSDDTYFRIIGVLKATCKDNGCILDHNKLAVEFIPPGFIIKNIFIDCPDPQRKLELVKRLADQTGDDTIKHTFDDNLRVNLYNSVNKEFADRVREELDLDVTHQFRALPPGSSRAKQVEILPMITVTTPKVKAEEEELDEMGMESGMEPGAEPGMEPLPPELGGGEEMGMPPPEMPAPGPGMPGEEPLMPGEEPMPGEEELGPGTPEEEVPPTREEEGLVSVEDIAHIADIIVEDLF